MNIPENWIETSIGAITLPVLKVNQQAESDREITYIDISSIDNENYVIKNTKRYQLGEAPSRARQIIHKGDTLFATVRPYLKNIAFVPEQLCGEIASTGFAVLRPANEVYPKYLFFYSISNIFVHKLSGIQYGVSYPAVNDEQIQVQPFPLPPFNEQRRIVEKIEELFSELDKGIESLKTAKEQLKVYRQALLKHAFEGKLTAQWREENKDKLESADQLLERIKAEREAHYQSQVKKWEQSVKDWESIGNKGKKPSCPCKPPAFHAFTNDELMKLPVLPFGWAWIRVGSLCDVVRGGSPRPAGDPTYYDGSIPFLKVADLTRTPGEYVKTYTYTIKEAGLQKTRFVHPPILMLSNSGATLGVPKICLIETTFNDGIAAFLDIQEGDLLYHYYFWESKTLELRAINQGAAQPNLNTDLIKDIIFPVCGKDEMQMIISLIREALSICEQTGQEIEQSILKCEVLRQSILNHAFSGQLVPQDPSDEPASVLLERIKAEKASQPKPQKSRKPKSKNTKEKEPEYEYV